MDSPILVSTYDAKALQIIGWFFTILLILPVLISMYLNFTWSSLVIFSISMATSVVLHRHNASIWNIWYEDGALYFQNIYRKEKVTIDQFDKIVMTSLFRNHYRLYLRDGQLYDFRLSVLKDARLWVKADDQHYAKQLTDMLRSIAASI